MDDTVIWIIGGAIVVGLFILVAVATAANEKAKALALTKKRAALLAKYNDPKLVELLMQEKIWQGQTQDMLVDSLGRPQDVDVKVLKTKHKEVWKYNRTGANRYGTRITLENGSVVGWDIK